ncbi:hypothetical protein HDU83_009445 [Entophlyctis luteolus]|nr:hypothetical protein HDU83_009445 [Entophlyctis luteolus]
MGNALLHAPDMSHLYADRRRGLGLLAALDDALLVAFLADPRLLPDHRSVLRLAQCSRAAYIFCSFDDIWRSRCIARFNGTFGPVFGLSWKNTFKSACVRLGHSLPLPERSEVTETTPACVSPFFSDYLFCSWRCAATPLDLLCRTSAPENIDRRSKLSVSDFIAEYDAPGIPVILTDVVPQWPAFTKWSMQYLADSFPDVVFRAESIDVPFSTYASYSARCCLDGGSFEEAPIYLFDKFFASRTDLTQDYSVPEYFSQDYFKLLGAENRPDYRWIIIGPPRSGSTFHIDPNSTSAWNAVIKGSKKWILFPPDCIPPGVFPSADGSEVTTPISLAEWFLNHYDEMKSWPVQPIECICREGELLYVPRGWWHCVMNIEETIAITQNFVNDCNLENVLQFIRTKGDQVSGYGSSESGCIMANTLLTRFTHALASSRIPKYLSILDYEQMKASVPTREIPSKQETPLSANVDFASAVFPAICAGVSFFLFSGLLIFMISYEAPRRNTTVVTFLNCCYLVMMAANTCFYSSESAYYGSKQTNVVALTISTFSLGLWQLFYILFSFKRSAEVLQRVSPSYMLKFFNAILPCLPIILLMPALVSIVSVMCDSNISVSDLQKRNYLSLFACGILIGNIDLYFAYMFFKYTNNLKQSALEESNKSADIRNAPAQLAGKTLDVIAIHGLISSSFIILVLVSSSVMVATFFFLNQLEEIDVIQRLLKCAIYIGMLGSSVTLVRLKVVLVVLVFSSPFASAE